MATGVRAGRVGVFFGWWRAELGAMLPHRPRRRPRLKRFLVATPAGDRLKLARRRARRVDELGSIPLDAALPSDRFDSRGEALLETARRTGLPVVLRLTPEDGLITGDVLPAGAVRELRAIVAHKLDLLTPWHADQVYFDAVVEDRRGDGRLEVAVAVARRPRVDQLCAVLEGHGLKPRLVDLVEDDDPYPEPRFDLLEGGSAPPRTGPVMLLGLVLLGGLLGGGAYAFQEIRARDAQIGQRQSFARALEARLDDLPALQDRLDGLRQRASFITERRRNQPSALVTIEALSRLLPDSVWLSELALERDRLVIHGHAADANMLIRLLEDSAHFTGAEFRAAVTRVRPEGAAAEGEEPREVDRFALGAEVRPMRSLGAY